MTARRSMLERQVQPRTVRVSRLVTRLRVSGFVPVRAPVIATAALALLTSCGASDYAEHETPQRPSAARAAALAPGEMPPPLRKHTRDSPSSAPSKPGPAANEHKGIPERDDTADRADGRGGNSNTSSAVRTPGTIATLADRRGDHGLEGPAYTDIVAVSINDGGRTAIVIVDVADDVPSRPRAGEVIGVAVDLWRNHSRHESDYQLFAEGGEDGWYAHLHTPQGLIEYPGEFRIGGRRLVFEVPWHHLGGMTAGNFRAFADWSQERLAVNAASQDHAPDKNTASFRR